MKCNQQEQDYNSGQDGRAVQGAAFRSQSGLPGVGSNPTPDKNFYPELIQRCQLFE